MKNILLAILLCACITSCNNEDSEQPNSTTITLDCVAGSGAEEFVIADDPYNIFTPPGYIPFNGYADPSIRKDPNSNRIWLAYSFPYIKQAGSNYVPSVAILLLIFGLKLFPIAWRCLKKSVARIDKGTAARSAIRGKSAGRYTPNTDNYFVLNN